MNLPRVNVPHGRTSAEKFGAISLSVQRKARSKSTLTASRMEPARIRWPWKTASHTRATLLRK